MGYNPPFRNQGYLLIASLCHNAVGASPIGFDKSNPYRHRFLVSPSNQTAKFFIYHVVLPGY